MGGGAAHLHDVAVGAGVEQYEEMLVLPVRAARPKYTWLSRARPRAAQSGELAVSARRAPILKVGAARASY